MVACRYTKFVRSKSNVTSGGLGTMDWLFRCIRSKNGSTRKEVIAVIGDGGYQMTIQELETIFQTQAAVKIVVLTMISWEWLGTGNSCFLINVMHQLKWLILILLLL